jgi:hypothetical protein
VIVAQNVGASTDVDSPDSEPERFLVVTNWFEKLRQRMGN